MKNGIPDHTRRDRDVPVRLGWSGNILGQSGSSACRTSFGTAESQSNGLVYNRILSEFPHYCSGSDVMFCLQSYQEIKFDRSLVY